MRSYLFTTIHLLLLAAASYFAVGLFYQAKTGDLGTLSTAPPPARASIAAPREAARPVNQYRIIAERNLFHAAAPKEAQAASKDVDLTALQKTKLDLKLWGTLILDRDRDSYAVIEDRKAGGQNLYQSGDQVQQAMVKMILRERVVLDVDGRDEILQIEEFTGASGARSGGPVRGPAPQVPDVEPPPEEPATPAEPTSQSITLKREVIENAVGDVASLMKQVRIRPFFEGGKPAGLSLAGIRPGSVFAQMGIRSGDVIRSVDGQPIQTVDDIIGLYQGLSESEGLSVQVSRSGKIEEIHYSVE